LAIHLGINKKRIIRVMRLFGIKPYRRRGRKFRKSDAVKIRGYPNLARGLIPKHEGELWAADFTYLPFKKSFVYLAPVMGSTTGGCARRKTKSKTMFHALLMIAVLVLFASGHTQGSPDFYIASLQMLRYPPLARQAQVHGLTKVRIEVARDGAVSSAEPIEGNPILLQAASVANVRTWKFAAGPDTNLSKLTTTVVFEYRLEGEPGWEKCAARVIFDSFNKVEIVAHPPIPQP
jgi:hypothetical protein